MRVTELLVITVIMSSNWSSHLASKRGSSSSCEPSRHLPACTTCGRMLRGLAQRFKQRRLFRLTIKQNRMPDASKILGSAPDNIASFRIKCLLALQPTSPVRKQCCLVSTVVAERYSTTGAVSMLWEKNAHAPTLSLWSCVNSHRSGTNFCNWKNATFLYRSAIL